MAGLTQADASSRQAYLCVSAQRDEASITRGHTAQWHLRAWARGNNVGNVVLHLGAPPWSQKPKFSNGCDAKEGTDSCRVGTVDWKSQAMQLQAQIPVSATARSVKSVKLTFWGSGSRVGTDPKVAVSITVTAPKAGGEAGSTGTAGRAGVGTVTPGVPSPAGVNSTLPVGGLPFLNGSGGSSTLSPGGNASSLFPTLHPGGGAPGGTGGTGGTGADSRARMAADELPGDASLVGAQYAGLGALALAFVLSVTRLSVRRRRASGQQG